MITSALLDERIIMVTQNGEIQETINNILIKTFPKHIEYIKDTNDLLNNIQKNKDLDHDFSKYIHTLYDMLQDLRGRNRSWNLVLILYKLGALVEVLSSTDSETDSESEDMEL